MTTNSYLASDKQICYLRLLLDKAFAKRIIHGLCLDRNHLNRVPREEASAAISTLKKLLDDCSVIN